MLRGFLLAAAAAISLYFTFHLSKELFHYFPLKAQTKASISHWEIEEKEGKFGFKARYSFEAQAKTWESSFSFHDPLYWNEPSAFKALKEKAKKTWNVWYDPGNPSHSALEKKFPFNLFFRTVICYGVLCYFFFINKKF